MALLKAVRKCLDKSNGAWLSGRQNGMSGVAVWRAMVEGQPVFFQPPVTALLPQASPANTNWYATTPLRATLERLVDFDRLNDAFDTRIAGAVNIRSGHFVYFDNTKDRLRAEHLMAFEALPPCFPAVEIDAEFYCDGGVVFNTSLFKGLGDRTCRNTLVFQVGLWIAQGTLPHDLAGVTERNKKIRYSSRTRMNTDAMRGMQERPCLLKELMALVLEARRVDPAWRRPESYAMSSLTNVIHLIYQDRPYESYFRAFEFSTASMHSRWHSGVDNMRHTLAHPQWLAVPGAEHPFVTHHVHRASTL